MARRADRGGDHLGDIETVSTRRVGAIPNPRALVIRLLEVSEVAEHGIHGLSHWARVAVRALELDPAADRDITLLFALLHDACRRADGEDPGHGHRAGQLARDLAAEGMIELDADQLEVLARACAEHTDGRTTGEPSIGACWDADRLDLGRVGIVPRPEFLSTPRARELAGSPSVWPEFTFQSVLELYAGRRLYPSASGEITVFHGTSLSREVAIRRDGLQRGRSLRKDALQEPWPGPFIARDRKTAQYYAFVAASYDMKGDGGVVFELRVPGTAVQWLESPEEGVLLAGGCSPEAIVSVTREDVMRQVQRWVPTGRPQVPVPQSSQFAVAAWACSTRGLIKW